MSSKILIVTILVVYFANVISLDALKVLDCTLGKQSDATLEQVTVAGCDIDNDAQCQFIRGQNATLGVQFKTTKSFSVAKLSVFGKIGVIPIPFPIKPDDACGNYGVNCPSKVDEEQKLQISIPVLRSYPKIGLSIQMKVADENGNPIVCIEFPVKISDPQ